jgi:hypothetical protein
MEVLQASFKLDSAMDGLVAAAAGFGDDGDEEIQLADDVRVALDGYIRERAAEYESLVTPIPAKQL